ncbi:MAG: hypothetical protein QOE35_2852 [Actinomycetota bacterium]
MLLDLLTVAVLAYVGSRLFVGARLALRTDVRRHIIDIVRGVRPRHVLLAPVALAAVLTAAVLLIQVPGLDWGWWTAIGGSGNPVVGVTQQTHGSPLEWIVPALFLTLLFPALPLFAEREERMFRAGAEERSTPQRIWRGVQFGLVHALIGIPIGVALALSIGGWYFTAMYLRVWRRTRDREAAVLESTRAHTVYNLEILLVVAVSLAFGL